MLGGEMSDISMSYDIGNDGNIYTLDEVLWVGHSIRPTIHLRVAPWYLFFFKLILDMLES